MIKALNELRNAGLVRMENTGTQTLVGRRADQTVPQVQIFPARALDG